MGKNLVIDSDVEQDLIEVFGTDKTEEEVLNDYLERMKHDARFSMVREIEKQCGSAVLEIDGEYGLMRIKVKVVEVPAKIEDDC